MIAEVFGTVVRQESQEGVEADGGLVYTGKEHG